MKEKKNISCKYRNIRNNLVKFADNLEVSHFKASQKHQHLEKKNESNQQPEEN